MNKKELHCEDDTEINLGVKELIELLKYLREENEQLKKEIAHLKNRLAYKDQHNNDDKFRGIEDWARGGF